MPERVFDEPGATPYVVRGPEAPEALVVIGACTTDEAFQRAREFAGQLASSNPSLAVAVPAAVADVSDDAFQVRRMANELLDEYTRPGQAVLFGAVYPDEVEAWENAGIQSLHGAYVLGTGSAGSREESLRSLPPLTDFTASPPTDGTELVRRLAAARDAQSRSAACSGLVDELRSAVERGEPLPRPAELPPGVVWAEESPDMANWQVEVAAREPAGIIERARAMSRLPVQGLVTNGQQVTGVYTHGVPAASQLTEVMIGHEPDVQFGPMVFDELYSNVRGAATIDTAIMQPFGPLKGWERKFGAALGAVLPGEGEQTLLITSNAGFESQAAPVVAGLLTERPDYRGRVGLLVESRSTIPVKLMLRESLKQLSLENDVKVLNSSDQTGDLADLHRRIAPEESRSEAPEPSQRQPLRKAFGLARNVGGPVKSGARKPGGPTGR